MGEALLSGFAARAKASRQLLGGGLLALGVGDVAWHFAAGNTPNTMFLVYKGALLGTLGAALLFVPHPAELEYDFFRAERRLDREHPPRFHALDFNLSTRELSFQWLSLFDLFPNNSF